MQRSRTLVKTSCGTLALLASLTANLPARAITGGNSATGPAYSFIAKLDIGGLRACTGALVQPRWVLTAASCFQIDGKPATFGPPSRKTLASIGHADLRGAGQPIEVVELVPYPGRNVVLLKLATAASGANPIPIATTTPAPGERLQVAGFGRTQTEWVPERLQVGAFSIQSVGADSLSILGEAQTNTCKGDSGGPTLRERNGQLELVAITSSSWQSGCLAEIDTRTGGTQTRIDDLAGWITGQPGAQRRHGSISWAMNGHCLDVLGNTKNRDPVRLWDCLAGDAPENSHDHQRWFFVNAEGRFKHRTDDHRKEPSLDFPMGAPKGTQLEIYEPNELISQKWSLSGGALINGVPGDHYPLLCLDVAGPIAEGTDLGFSSCNGSDGQRFALPGDGSIRSATAPYLCVDNDANRRAEGNAVQLWGCNDTAAQKWDLSKQGLVNDGASFGTIFGCLDRDIAFGGGAGSRAQFWTCNAQSNQYFEYLGGVRNGHDYCMEARDPSGQSGVAVQASTCTASTTQQFYYTP
ncbi:MAG TPA: ricin-type beta-trefoil lectin domain protein [Polyangiaceae bacterium]|nr:ricin-type beta-trefoil lectin domain protein [Polyangiaceae bacterium]